MQRPQTTRFYRRRLPHGRVADRSYFVTFRLHGTLPASLRREAENHRAVCQQCDDELSRRFHRLMFRRIETVLDRPDPSVDFLAYPNIAGLVKEAFNWTESHCGWRVPAFAILPNHVHALFAAGPVCTRDLSRTLGSIKGYTAYEANCILKRRGRCFWQHESFDHWCRSAEQEEGIERYIRQNPVKAGLVTRWEDWPWVK